MSISMSFKLAQQAAKRVTLNINGCQQVWHAWNEHAADVPLVLFHGGSGSWSHWCKNVLALSKVRPVWALDLPGFGDSELPQGVQDVDDLIEPVALGLQLLFEQRPINVAGFSFGGMLAGLLAAQYPQRFKTVLMLGTPGLGLFDGPPPHIRGFLPDMTVEQRMEIHRHNLKSFMLKHDKSITEETLQLQADNVARDRMKRRRLARTDVVVKAQHQWSCPVHFAFGDSDRLYPDRLQLIPALFETERLSSFTLIEDAGHWVMYEKPDDINAWIVAKLK